MNWVRPSAVIFILGTFVAGCGNGNVTLSIDPTDTIVKRGLTQQFTANEDQVTWSVDGGSSNGAINGNGLYTAPNALPANPTVTVRATKGQEAATATVHLVTSDTLVFSTEPTLVSQDPDHRMDDEGTIGPGAQDRLALAQNGARVDATWGAFADVYFNQQLNSAGFGSDQTVTDLGTALALGVEEDQDGNPVLLFNSSPFSNGRVQVMTSPDGGANFGAPVTVFPSAPGDFQFQASLAVDEQNVFHVVLENGPNSGVGLSAIDGTLFYSKSEDGGVTWSANPLAIVTPEGPDDILQTPHLQIDSQGNIYVCYSVDPDGGADPNGETFDLFLAKSADGGASFVSTNLTPGSTTDKQFCRLSLGPDGEINISYNSGILSETDVLFQRSVDGGASFSSPITVNSDTAGRQGQAFLSTDIAGRIAAVWAADTDQNELPDTLMYSQSLDGGKTFAPNLEIAGGPPADFTAPMGLRHDLAGRLHVLFASNPDNPGFAADVYYLKGE
ncbi:MAG TPA: hypothetical protein VJP40_04855 [bacterium]|nr:hypothetical protein [bacterium]